MSRRLFLSLLLLVTGEAIFAAGELPPSTRDWNLVADIARTSHAPVLVVFTDADCGYCARLKSTVLDPLRDQISSEVTPLVREYRMNTEGKILDFDGTKTRARTFLRRYGVYAVPTVVLVDANGQPLGEPIVGFDNTYDYRELLNARLAMAREILQERALSPSPAYAGNL